MSVLAEVCNTDQVVPIAHADVTYSFSKPSVQGSFVKPPSFTLLGCLAKYSWLVSLRGWHHCRGGHTKQSPKSIFTLGGGFTLGSGFIKLASMVVLTFGKFHETIL